MLPLLVPSSAGDCAAARLAPGVATVHRPPPPHRGPPTPAGPGTTILMGRLGQFDVESAGCACARLSSANDAVLAKSTRREISGLFMVVSKGFGCWG